jgi:hypothetical protein
MSKCNIKYSKELLEQVAKECTSYQQVMRKLGLKISGGSSSHLKSRFIKYNVDISLVTLLIGVKPIKVVIKNYLGRAF